MITFAMKFEKTFVYINALEELFNNIIYHTDLNDVLYKMLNTV